MLGEIGFFGFDYGQCALMAGGVIALFLFKKWFDWHKSKKWNMDKDADEPKSDKK